VGKYHPCGRHQTRLSNDDGGATGSGASSQTFFRATGGMERRLWSIQAGPNRMLSNRQNVQLAKLTFRVRRALDRFAKRTADVLARLLRAVWSFRGVLGIAAAALVFSLVNLLISVHGKLVILPFEIYSDQKANDDLGTAFAATLAARLNDYRNIFPSSDPSRKTGETASPQTYFDVVQVFMTELPLVNIPRSSPLNKGSIAIESFKIGDVSIPISRLIFQNFTRLHHDVLRGSLEIWGDELRARVSMAGLDELTISMPKTKGLGALADRLAAELLRQKKWLTPYPMSTAALPSFTDGLMNYLDYVKSADQEKLTAARSKYAEAIAIDPNADLARLHLATLQRESWQEVELHAAVENFNILLDNKKYGSYAKMGYVASLIRYVERTDDCNAAYEYIDRALDESKEWGSPVGRGSQYPLEKEILYAYALYQEASFLLPNNECAPVLRAILAPVDVNSVIERSTAAYTSALASLRASNVDEDLKRRYGLSIRLNLKYLLDERNDVLISMHQPDESLARQALAAGQALEREKEGPTLTDEQRHAFAPYLADSNAASFLRLATVAKEDEKMELVSNALRELHSELTEPTAAAWTMLRVADLEYARNQPRQAIEWLDTYFHSVKADASFRVDLEAAAIGFGVFLEKPEGRCRIIEGLRAAVTRDKTNILAGMLLADALRRSGALPEAKSVIADVMRKLERSTEWQGETTKLRLLLISEKISATAGGDQNRNGMTVPSEQQLASAPHLLVDVYELGELLHDDAILTLARTGITNRMPNIMKVVESLGSGFRPACRKAH
jgi:hypothetical protein